MSDDFHLTDELLHIMEGLDTFPECCRANLLKMTAAWEQDMIKLPRQGEKSARVAKYWKARYLREIGEP